MNNYIVEYNTLDNIISTFVIGDRKLFTLLKQYNEVVFMNSSYIVLVQDDSAEQASEQGRLYISDLIASQRNHSIEESLLMQKQAKKYDKQLSKLQKATFDFSYGASPSANQEDES